MHEISATLHDGTQRKALVVNEVSHAECSETGGEVFWQLPAPQPGA